MSYPIFETHTHVYFPTFDNIRDEVTHNAIKNGVKHQVQIGCDEISSLAALFLARKNKTSGFFATLGLHPCDVGNVGKKSPEHRYSGFENYSLKAHNFDQLFELFEKLFLENKDLVVGFGETGFDLYHENTPEILTLQQDSFTRHIQLCEKHDRAMVVHTREAREITLAAFETNNIKQRNIRGVIHCFSEDAAFAKIMTEEYGFFLGFGGVATYKNANSVREAIAQTPIEFLVTETDAPFLVPQKFRSKGEKINQPAFLTEVVELIAEIKNIPEIECGNILFENGKRLFAV